MIVGQACFTAAVAGVVMLAGGCGGDTDPDLRPTPLQSFPITHDLGPLTPEEEQAVASAITAIEGYIVVFDALYGDPDRDLSELEQVAADTALEVSTDDLTAEREAGHQAVGEGALLDIVSASVELDPADDESDHAPSVELTACVSPSDDVVDEDGNSIVGPDRSTDQALADYVVEDTGTPGEPNWLVVFEDFHITDNDPPEFVPCP